MRNVFKIGEHEKKSNLIVIIGEGGYFFMCMKLRMADTSFLGKQKGGGTWGINLFTLAVRSPFTNQSVERIRKYV